MKVSIVTISYNQAEFLEKAIRSVIEQDYDDIEYIIVDSGSTDGSREIIERYRSGIDKIIFEPDDGPADGLNKGFGYATGDIYGYLNADDILFPGVLEKVKQSFSKEKDIDVISAHCYVIDRAGKIIQKAFSHKFNLKQYLMGNCVLIQQSTFFRSKIFKKAGGFNPNNRVNWDGELAIDVSLTGASFKVIQDYWSGFRVYEESITGSHTYREKLRKSHKGLQAKIEFKKNSKFSRRIYWVLNWLSQPRTLTRRIYDRFIHPNRVI